MKTIAIITTLIVLVCLKTFGQKQEISLSFTAMSKGNYLPLDSTRVENPARGCDTTLYFPDTVLVLDMVVGIHNNPRKFKQVFILEQNFPNPFQQQTTFNIFMPEWNTIAVSVSDLSGRNVAEGKYNLSEGWHAFQVDGGDAATYLVTVICGDASESIRLFAIPGGEKNRIALTYSGLVKGSKGSLKTGTGDSFVFLLGDTLHFTGFAKTSGVIRGSDFIEDSPVQNHLYTFNITEGIPCPAIPCVVYEGKTYHTIEIDLHCWLKENLDVGVMLNADSNQTNNSIIEKYCYNNNPVNCTVYGGLYQWDEAMQYSMTQGVQGICPPGWHLPTDAEWTALSLYLGGQNSAGGHLKEAGTFHWYPPNTGADNSSGFTALPAGMYFNGAFGHFKACVEIWSSTYSYGPYSWYRILYNDNTHFTRTNYFERWTSRSVRCMLN